MFVRTKRFKYNPCDPHMFTIRKCMSPADPYMFYDAHIFASAKPYNRYNGYMFVYCWCVRCPSSTHILSQLIRTHPMMRTRLSTDYAYAVHNQGTFCLGWSIHAQWCVHVCLRVMHSLRMILCHWWVGYVMTRRMYVMFCCLCSTWWRNEGRLDHIS